MEHDEAELELTMGTMYTTTVSCPTQIPFGATALAEAQPDAPALIATADKLFCPYNWPKLEAPRRMEFRQWKR